MVGTQLALTGQLRNRESEEADPAHVQQPEECLCERELLWRREWRWRPRGVFEWEVPSCAGFPDPSLKIPREPPYASSLQFLPQSSTPYIPNSQKCVGKKAVFSFHP